MSAISQKITARVRDQVPRSGCKQLAIIVDFDGRRDHVRLQGCRHKGQIFNKLARPPTKGSSRRLCI